MAFKFDTSEEGFEPSLDLFKPPGVNTAIEKREWISYRPVSQITKGSPIHFTISGTSPDYKDMRKTLLFVKCKIKKANGNPITREDSVGFCNLTLQSLFRQVDVSLQQQVMTSGVGLNYCYKSMIDVLLKLEEDTMESRLQSQLYFKDDASFMDSIDGNVGLIQRQEFTKGGRYVDLEGPLYVDLCQQEKLVINGIQVDVKLYPHSDTFVLMSKNGDEQYTYEIGEAILKVCHVKLNPGILISHAEKIKKSPAIYPYTKSDVRTFNIQPGSYAWGMDDIFQGRVPNRVVVCLIAGQAYSGSFQKNPYNFQHFNCNYVGLFVDGQSVPGDALQCSYKDKHYVSAYHRLFSGADKINTSEGNYITRDDFPKGYCLYVFDLTAKTSKEYQDLVKKGHTRLTLRFDESPSETITALVYSSFPAIFQIDESRSVIH